MYNFYFYQTKTISKTGTTVSFIFITLVTGTQWALNKYWLSWADVKYERYMGKKRDGFSWMFNRCFESNGIPTYKTSSPHLKTLYTFLPEWLGYPSLVCNKAQSTFSNGISMNHHCLIQCLPWALPSCQQTVPRSFHPQATPVPGLQSCRMSHLQLRF